MAAQVDNFFQPFVAGVHDAVMFPYAFIVALQSRVIRNYFGLCTVLNGVLFLGSLALYELILSPGLWWLLASVFSLDKHDGAGLVHNTFEWTYKLFWVYPIFVLSQVISLPWYSTIAQAAYMLEVGKPARPAIGFSSLIQFISDELYRLLLFISYSLFLVLVQQLPYPIGYVTAFFFSNWLYSFYSFEYKWVLQGWNLQTRIDYFEEHWQYFAGYGAPVTLATYFLPYFYSIGLFALLFPVFVVLANTAKPVRTRGIHRLPVFAVPQGMTDVVLRCIPTTRRGRR